MNVAGIIAEYNPFHNGHAWQMAETRRQLGEDTAIVCVLGASATQRGDLPIYNKWARAQAAVLCGADLVLELPTEHTCVSATRFAEAGVALLHATGVCTHLVFGSELGRLSTLQEAAGAMSREDYGERLRHELRSGDSFPAANQRVLENVLGHSLPWMAEPNNILSLTYLQALRKTSLTPLTLPRQGAAHDASRTDGVYASAGQIRRGLYVGHKVGRFLPPATWPVWMGEKEAGRGPVTLFGIEQTVLSHLRRLPLSRWEQVPDVSEGLGSRLFGAARDATKLSGLWDAVKTKRYTHARIRRICLCAYLGITETLATQPPQYLRVLAIGEKGRELLRAMKRTATLPTIVKPADVRFRRGAARNAFDREAGYTDIVVFAYPSQDAWVGGQEWTTTPFVLHP